MYVRYLVDAMLIQGSGPTWFAIGSPIADREKALAAKQHIIDSGLWHDARVMRQDTRTWELVEVTD